ncbi:MAG: hypothetical protein KDC39_13995 [Actinobacteria bacterium]|nr:hypothetical protein [Actinomycetota bacterium]
MTSNQPTPEERRIGELQAEVARLQSQLADRNNAGAVEADRGGRGVRWTRTAVSFVLALVVVILAPLSVVTVWQSTIMTNTDEYVATVGPLIHDPAVQEAVSDRISTAILDHVDVETLTTEAVNAISENRELSPRAQQGLEALTGPLASGITSFTESEVANFVASDAMANLWVTANRIGNQELNAVLSGDTQGSVTVEDGKVYLQLGDVLDQVKQRLVAKGFGAAERIPAVDTQILIFQSDDLGTAQRVYAMINTLGVWLPIVLVVMFVAAVLVANSARAVVAGVGFALVVSMLVLAGGVSLGGEALLNSLPPDASEAAVSAVYIAVTEFLRESMRAGALFGLFLGLGAVLTGPSRFATGLRRGCVRMAAATARGLQSLGVDVHQTAVWLAPKATAFRAVLTVIAIAAVLIPNHVSPVTVLWAAVALLALLFVVQVFAGGAQQEASATGASDAEARQTSSAGHER